VYNRDHLDFIERLVAAKQRERRIAAMYGWSNRSLASRLPRWVKLAKNRDAVLTAIRRMRARLPSAPCA
jgi:hypothetical protein